MKSMFLVFSFLVVAIINSTAHSAPRISELDTTTLRRMCTAEDLPLNIACASYIRGTLTGMIYATQLIRTDDHILSTLRANAVQSKDAWDEIDNILERDAVKIDSLITEGIRDDLMFCFPNDIAFETIKREIVTYLANHTIQIPKRASESIRDAVMEIHPCN